MQGMAAVIAESIDLHGRISGMLSNPAKNKYQ
jgi:hypothetical protein